MLMQTVSKDKTEAEYDAIYDQLTNAGDVICFVNGNWTAMSIAQFPVEEPL